MNPVTAISAHVAGSETGFAASAEAIAESGASPFAEDV
jgi:hypothetical protein